MDQEQTRIRAQTQNIIKEIQEHLGCNQMIPYLSRNYLGRYLSRTQFLPPLIEETEDRNWELLAFSCFSLGWKMSNDDSLISELSKKGGKWGFESRNIMKMETEILIALKFEMRPVTSLDAISMDATISAIAKDFFISFKELDFTALQPSAQMALAVVLELVPKLRLVEDGYVNSADVEECRKMMKDKLKKSERTGERSGLTDFEASTHAKAKGQCNLHLSDSSTVAAVQADSSEKATTEVNNHPPEAAALRENITPLKRWSPSSGGHPKRARTTLVERRPDHATQDEQDSDEELQGLDTLEYVGETHFEPLEGKTSDEDETSSEEDEGSGEEFEPSDEEDSSEDFSCDDTEEDD